MNKEQTQVPRCLLTGQIWLCGCLARSAEALERRLLVFIDIEHRKKLGDGHQIDDFFRKVQQFQHTAASLDRSIASNELPEAAGIDMRDPRQIQQDILLASINQLPDRVV